MLFPGIKRIAKELGLERTDSIAVGLVGNCHVSLYDGNSMKVMDVTFPEVTALLKERISLIMKKQFFHRVEWLGSLLRISFFELVWPYSVRTIKQRIMQISETSLELFPLQTVLCASCKTDQEVATYYADNSVFYVCPACADKVRAEYRQAEQDFQNRPNHYVPATIVGFLCAVPGILVSVFLFIFLSRIAALASVIYAFLIVWGYRKANGKTNKAGAVLVVLATTLLTFAGTGISYILNLLYINKSLQEVYRLLTFPEIRSELVANMVVSGLVSGLFLMFQYFELRKNWTFPVLKRAYMIRK